MVSPDLGPNCLQMPPANDDVVLLLSLCAYCRVLPCSLVGRQTVWTPERTDTGSVLTWVLTVCKYHKQTTMLSDNSVCVFTVEYFRVHWVGDKQLDSCEN